MPRLPLMMRRAAMCLAASSALRVGAVQLVTCATLLLIFCAPALAQQQELPLRMTLLNVAESGGQQATNQLLEILEPNEALEVIAEVDVRAQMDTFGVNDTILRQGSMRQKFRSRISRMNVAQGIEGMLLVDVYNKGRTLQLVVIGPGGEELLDLKRTIKNGALSRNDAIELLSKVFPVLGPEVLAYRERTAQAATTPEELGFEPDAFEDPEVEVVTPKASTETDYFARGIDLGIGYFFGTRAMLVEEVDNNNPDRIRHRTRISGVGAEVDATAIAFGEEGRNALALRGLFSIGFFNSTFKRTDDGKTTDDESFASSLTDVSGDLILRKMVGSKAQVGALFGVQNISLSISQTARDNQTTNSIYTGNGYLMGRAGLEGGFRFSDAVHLQAHAALLPTFWADNSAGALGESPTSLGYHAGARLKLNFTPNLFAQLRYTFTFLQPTFPDPPGRLPNGEVKIDSSAESTDAFHNMQIIIGLSF